MVGCGPAAVYGGSGGRHSRLCPGSSLTVQRHDPLARDAAAGAGSDVTLAPMPGLVKAVAVVAGQAVAQGDALCILEAMKMEHALRAARDGVVAEVLVQNGQQIEAGAALIRLEAEA